ncbi:hypothetical protein DCCM_3186 [Desulfocucumis palustris]|uniref:Uncharacterized protein n=1 Tax=Desulfocucumis palustris TaxID=1898651 RepID=A0A2L2XDH1_9FIRM|nr:hypothetical protein [Desulfocucumis palustris]GBF34074.1 hypothetical protein DCCM_3186 [Desulfocucumis palustris]
MRKERPSFDNFKQCFKDIINEYSPGIEVPDSTKWTEIADGETRNKILRRMKERMEVEYGVELVIAPEIYNLDTSLEGLLARLHHVFSTVYLMERINDKIRARQH